MRSSPFSRALGATLTTVLAIGLTACSTPPPDGSPSAAAARVTADAIYSGGPIVTVDEAHPSAEAVAVKDGRIVVVGTRADAEALRGPATVVHDLAGRTLLPGFVDAHGHVSTVGLQAVSANLLAPPDGPNASIALLEQSARAWMKTSPVAGTYGLVIGFGYDDSQLQEQRHPTRDDLDRISADLPVYFIHQSGHLGVANSRALELSGITAATPDPPGGVIRRRAGSKAPNGVLEENAHFMVLMQLVFAKLGPEQLRGMLMAGQDLYTKYGFTTAQDGATDAVSLQGFIAAAAAGQLKIDIVAYPGSLTLGDGAVMEGPYHSRSYAGRFRIGGIKVILDGSPQGKTAWLSQPYFKPPAGQPASYAGYPALPDAEARAIIERAFSQNWQVMAHVNGDAAIDQFLDAVEAAAKKHPGGDRRPVAIHDQTTRLDQIDRMKALGGMPSFFPMHTFYWGDWHRDSVLGAERAENISPTGWALQRGMKFTTHHDAPVAFPDSMRVLAATVTRTTRSGRVLGPSQRIAALDAIKAMTIWSAYQHFEEATKGSIEAGKVADFVVLSDNPLTVDPARLAGITVLETIKAGQSIYRRP